MGEKQKVLIVDDEPRNIRIIMETFDDLVELRAAKSGEEALEMIESFAPDLVLLDIMMPGANGYEICGKIRVNPRLSRVKIILVSGKALLEERLKGYEVGADDYMTKPFVSEELLAKSKVFLRLTLVEKQMHQLNQALDEKTERLVNTQAQLVQSAKMAALGEMAGGVAHEINTPLSTISIIGEQIGELLEEPSPDLAAIKEMAKTIGQTVQRIALIVRGLRTFSRDGKQDRMTTVPVKQIFEETIALCGEKIKYGNIDLKCGAIPEDLLLTCRSIQISQLLLNLIGNACDAIASLPEKWIQVTVEKQEGVLQITITDSGGGISETNRSRLFQPFFTTKDIGKGTGLGLSISKGIAEDHHGTLALDPDCPNTRFVFRMPVEHEPEPKASAAPGKAA